jgi:hypothetical protein
MPRYSILLAAAGTTLIGLMPAVAQQPQQPQPQQRPARPCAAIRQVCLQAGFVLNGARAGEGVVVDCIRPIMQGTPQPRRATKPLPAVDPALIEACRAQNPSFGVRNAQGPQMPRNAPRQAAPGAPPQDAPPPNEPPEPSQEEPAPPKN